MLLVVFGEGGLLECLRTKIIARIFSGTWTRMLHACAIIKLSLSRTVHVGIFIHVRTVMKDIILYKMLVCKGTHNSSNKEGFEGIALRIFILIRVP